MAISADTTNRLHIALASVAAGDEIVTALNTPSEGNTAIGGTLTVTAAVANTVAVGPAGATSATFSIDASVASAVTGINIIGRAAGAGVTLATISSGTDEDLLVAPKGAGGIKVTSTSANSLAVGRQGATSPTLKVDSSATTCVTGLIVTSAASGSGLTLAVGSSAAAEKLVVTCKTATNALTLNDTLAAATSPLVQTVATDTITGAVTDAFTGGLELAPTINAATAQTVTRHNYINCKNLTLGGTGPAAVTNACFARFDAAAGTHKAVDAASTKSTPSGVDAWVKINISGTLFFVPAYLSKTA